MIYQIVTKVVQKGVYLEKTKSRLGPKAERKINSTESEEVRYCQRVRKKQKVLELRNFSRLVNKTSSKKLNRNKLPSSNLIPIRKSCAVLSLV